MFAPDEFAFREVTILRDVLITYQDLPNAARKQTTGWVLLARSKADTRESHAGRAGALVRALR